MRRVLCFCLAAALCVTTARAEGIVRMHVFAQDDTPRAQQIKLAVRDALLRRFPALYAPCASRGEKLSRLRALLPALEATARAAAQKAGHTGRVRVALSRRAFGARMLAGTCYPAGVYDALTVTLGAGGGRNWWGILYPEACGLPPGAAALEWPLLEKLLRFLRGG